MTSLYVNGHIRWVVVSNTQTIDVIYTDSIKSRSLFQKLLDIPFSERSISHVNSLVIDQPLLCHVESVNSIVHILSFDYWIVVQ